MLNKLKLFYRRSRILSSLRTRIFILILLIGLVPCILLHYSILQAYHGRAVSVRTSEVRTQMRVLANHLITYNYMENPSSYTVNAELDLFSTLNDGRVLVIDSHLKVIKDTYAISEGKTIVTAEVVRCLQEGTPGASSGYDPEDGYIEMVTPIVETASLEAGDFSGNQTAEEKVRGVLLTSVSTDSIVQTMEALSRTAMLIEVLFALIILFLAFLLSGRLVAPFNRLTQHITEVKEGFSTELVQEPAYYETEQIVGAFNRVLARMRTLDESRSEFVSNVSHELKTPMASMKVLADSLLQNENVPVEMYREFLTDIDAEIDRENKIISDLLSLVKLDNKEVRMNITKVNIGDLTEIICRRIRPLAQKRDIEITLVVERPVVAEIDEVKMTLVLTNLIENAVKYNKEHGKVNVTLDADHQNFTVTVEDTGIGIPEDSIDRIYERFYRVDKSRSREVGGTGLGLAITKNAVLLHRGTIKVRSKLGEGSIFTVTIPLIYNATPISKERANARQRRREQTQIQGQLEHTLQRTEEQLRRTQAKLHFMEHKVEEDRANDEDADVKIWVSSSAAEQDEKKEESDLKKEEQEAKKTEQDSKKEEQEAKKAEQDLKRNGQGAD